MRPVALSDEIAVGEMPSADEIAILAKAGFRSVLNVQPDGEVDRLLASTVMAASAEAAGLKYDHIPVATRRVPDDTVAAFAKAMVTLPRPIYACCYSGARAAAAWALAVAPAMKPHDIASTCSTAGYDMSALVPELERRHLKKSAAADAPSVLNIGALNSGAHVADVPPTAMTAAVAEGPVIAAPQLPASAPSPVQTTATAAVTAAEKIIFPRAAGAGGFAVSG
jgi:uncharacterized protein (TIGR01244 family)